MAHVSWIDNLIQLIRAAHHCTWWRPSPDDGQHRLGNLFLEIAAHCISLVLAGIFVLAAEMMRIERELHGGAPKNSCHATYYYVETNIDIGVFFGRT